MRLDLKGFTYLGDTLWVKIDSTGVDLRIGDGRPCFLSPATFRRLMRAGIRGGIPLHTNGHEEAPPPPHTRDVPLLTVEPDRDEAMARWEEALRRKAAAAKVERPKAADRPISDLA